MNKKRLIFEIITLSFLLLFIYLSCFLFLYISSKKNSENILKDNLKIAMNIFNGSEESGEILVDYYSSLNQDDDVRVSIIASENSSYNIIYDSKNLLDINVDPIELENLNSFTQRKSTYGYNMIYLASKDDDSNFFIRVGVKENSVTLISKNFALYGTPILILLIGIFIYYKLNYYKKIVKPMQNEISKLNALSGNEIYFDKEDDVEALSNSIIKISDKLNEENNNLKKEQEKTKIILNSISSGFMAISSERKIILYNNAMTKIFPYKEIDVIGKDFSIIIATKEFTYNINEVLKENKDINPFDMQLNSRIYSVSIMKLENVFEEKGGVAVLILDVTEERNITNMKNDFFSNASHELKSPLTSILGYQEMIESGIIEDEIEKQQAIKKTIEEAKRMKEILSDMLVLNKLDNDKVKKDYCSIFLLETLKNITNNYLPQMKDKNINLSLNESDFIIKANKEDIERLISNLIDNSIKYNRINGNITINISSEDKSVAISDTGIGIQEENISRIFERFYRVDNSRGKENIEGSGLGLSIVKHICETYGYQINVKSTYKVGTCFTIYFK